MSLGRGTSAAGGPDDAAAESKKRRQSSRIAAFLNLLWKPRPWAALVLIALSLVFMLGLFPRAAALSGSKENRVMDLQKAYTPVQFESVLTAWSKTDDRAVGLVKSENIIKLDFVFPLVYSLALALTFAALAGGRTRTRWATVFLIAPFVAAALDYAENVTHLWLLSGIETRAQVEAAVTAHVFSPALVFLASAFAYVKYRLLLISALSIVGVGAGWRLRPPVVRLWRSFAGPSGVGGAVDFGDVLKEEFDYIGRRRFYDQPPAQVKHSLVGLALSGGGIRSATTCLGMLQTMSRLKILPLVDYMCTVSGGGYIGSCLSSLLSLDFNAATISSGGTPQFRTAWSAFPFNPDAGGPGAAQIRHLRTHGSFLVTRKGILKRETLRSVGQLLSGTIYHLVLAALTLTSIALLYMTLLFRAAPDVHNLLRQVTEPVATIAQAYESTLESTVKPRYDGQSPVAMTSPGTPAYKIPVRYEYPSLWERIKAKASVIWAHLNLSAWPKTLATGAAVGVLVALGAFTYLQGYRRITLRLTPTAPTPKAGESAEEALSRRVLRRAGYGSLVVIIAALVTIIWLVKPAASVLVLLPVVMLASLRTMAWLLHIWLPRTEAWTRDMRSFWGAYQATADYTFWMVILLAAVPVLVYALREHDTATALTGLGSLVIARVLTFRKEVDAKKRPISAAVLRWALALAIGIGIVLVVVSICTIIVPDSANTDRIALTTALGFGATALLLVLLSTVGDSNRLSPHYFYRDRLAEAYLYTDRVRQGKTSLESLRDSLELLLRDLHYAQPAGQTPALTDAPLHLISAAINLAGSRDLTRKDRKSGYFVFSKFFCGSRHTGFRPTAEYSQGDVKLARAVTISGAAASSGIGSGTFFAQAFATVLFNLRLGFWMPNPAKASSTGQWLNDRWHFWPKWLWREVTMGTDERHSLVNLSDGGHTGDNVGIYPLLQRRCKLIIACDAECDASLTFGSFTEALRHAYVDLGIDVDIDLTMLRPDRETGLSRSHSAVGLIRYPAAAGLPRQVGYLVYLKNSLTGDEPEPVLNYKSSNPAFPHESTADQFFDDDQFESYRALGVHIAEHAFAQWVHGAPFERWRQAAEPVERATY